MHHVHELDLHCFCSQNILIATFGLDLNYLVLLLLVRDTILQNRKYGSAFKINIYAGHKIRMSRQRNSIYSSDLKFIKVTKALKEFKQL